MPAPELQIAELLDGVSEKYLDALLEKDRLCYLGYFVQGVIHNVNGPLQNLSMLGEILLKGQESQDAFILSRCGDSLEEWQGLSAKQRKRLAQLSQQIIGLADMMRDFMVLHEIERNETEVDLNLILSKLVNVFRSDLFFKHQVTLDLQLARNLPLVRILGRHLIPALVHIFRNALSAMCDTPEKRLTIRSCAEDRGIHVDFRDSGCGVSKDCRQRDDLFGLFYSCWQERQAKFSREERHLGIGLFAVHRLLSPYGVQVRVEDCGDGTLVTLDIPARQEPRAG